MADYLDRLIGQNEKIRPVIQCGNQVPDILLNGKLSAAVNQGIGVEIIRSQAPEQIPLSDMELCSLMMNLMDNAIAAASASGAEHPYYQAGPLPKGFFLRVLLRKFLHFGLGNQKNRAWPWAWAKDHRPNCRSV